MEKASEKQPDIVNPVNYSMKSHGNKCCNVDIDFHLSVKQRAGRSVSTL